MRRHLNDSGQGCQADVATIVRLDIFDHSPQTFIGNVGPPFYAAQLNEDTISREHWSNVPVLVKYSDLVGQKDRPTMKRRMLVPSDIQHGR